MLDVRIKQLIIFCGLFYIFLLTTHYTTADIFAERNVLNNKFTTITLDFFSTLSYNKNKIEKVFDIEKILPFGYDIKSVRIENNSSVEFKYEIKNIITDQTQLCDNLDIKMLDKTFKTLYSGTLLDMKKDLRLEPNKIQDFIFMLSLNENDTNLKNQTCNFDIQIKTYRDNIDEVGGIHAKRILKNTITSGNW